MGSPVQLQLRLSSLPRLNPSPLSLLRRVSTAEHGDGFSMLGLLAGMKNALIEEQMSNRVGLEDHIQCTFENSVAQFVIMHIIRSAPKEITSKPRSLKIRPVYLPRRDRIALGFLYSQFLRFSLRAAGQNRRPVYNTALDAAMCRSPPLRDTNAFRGPRCSSH